MKRIKTVAGSVLLLCVLGGPVIAPTTSFANPTADQQELGRQIQSLGWYKAGQTGDIAGKATFLANGQYTFLNSADTDRFLILNGNPPVGTGYTVATLGDEWFAILSFSAEGYVKDDEKIDAAALLESLKKNNEADSERRRQTGYPVLTLLGWAIPPRYDSANNRLEWATLFREETNKSVVVNASTKLLGRSGYTSVTLVSNSPENVEKALADFKQAMANFSYVSGEKYSEWKQGDKVAAYGLGALVLGGAAAVATSKGGLKAIAVAALAGLAALWAGFKKLFGRKKAAE